MKILKFKYNFFTEQSLNSIEKILHNIIEEDINSNFLQINKNRSKIFLYGRIWRDESKIRFEVHSEGDFRSIAMVRISGAIIDNLNNREISVTMQPTIAVYRYFFVLLIVPFSIWLSGVAPFLGFFAILFGLILFFFVKYKVEANDVIKALKRNLHIINKLESTNETPEKKRKSLDFRNLHLSAAWKLRIYQILYYINIFWLICFIIPFMLRMQIKFDFYKNTMIVNFRLIIGILASLFWIINLIIWSKHDKDRIRLLLLIFLNSFYIPFYFVRALKNNWV